MRSTFWTELPLDATLPLTVGGEMHSAGWVEHPPASSALSLATAGGEMLSRVGLTFSLATAGGETLSRVGHPLSLVTAGGRLCFVHPRRRVLPVAGSCAVYAFATGAETVDSRAPRTCSMAMRVASVWMRPRASVRTCSMVPGSYSISSSSRLM